MAVALHCKRTRLVVAKVIRVKRMEGKKVLNISIEKVVCATKDGDMALPGLQSGEAFVRGEPVERKSAAKAPTFGLVGAPPPLTLPMEVLLPATQA